MGLGVVAIADPPTAIHLKVPFSDGLGGAALTGRYSSHGGQYGFTGLVYRYLSIIIADCYIFAVCMKA